MGTCLIIPLVMQEGVPDGIARYSEGKNSAVRHMNPDRNARADRWQGRISVKVHMLL